MTPPNRQVALSFLAHPDDAEILCAGTLIRLADAGWDVHIATATPGDCGSSTLLADQIAEIRRGEATTAARKIGATYHCLEERDVNVRLRQGGKSQGHRLVSQHCSLARDYSSKARLY